MPKLSVTIITRNEADDIAEALASVAWADERLVIDSGSTDATVAIATAAGARVLVRDWPGYGAQKNVAAMEATHDWVLSIDADERVPPALAAEIQRAVAAPDACAYRLPRVTWHLGRWIRGTDWFPDLQTRLYDRRHARWTETRVHESVTVQGPVGHLQTPLEHYAYRTISEHLDTIDRYTTLAAQQMAEAGRRGRLWQIAVHPPLAFLRNYLLRGGWRLGTAGFIVSAMNAWYVGLKYAKLWERQLRDGARP
mgnify:CR=1 FL=1